MLCDTTKLEVVQACNTIFHVIELWGPPQSIAASAALVAPNEIAQTFYKENFLPFFCLFILLLHILNY
jgi:hypothetical protein